MNPETQQPALQQLLLHVSNYSNYYKRVFRDHQINVDAIRSVADLARLPFTTKDDLAQYNDDFLCVPKSRITDFVTTSGTLSDPVAFYLTDSDVERLATNEAQSFRCAGGRKTIFTN